MTNIRWLKLVERLGSEEAARAEMRRRASTSSRNAAGTGGFAHMKATDPKRLKKISQKAVKSRWKKPNAEKQDDPQS